jgi:hypothetical protein
MKKLFLLLAFTGIVSAASANSIAIFTKSTITATVGDDKKGDDKKACCKKDGNGKSGCADGKGGTKSCCHAKTEAKATTTSTATTKK